MRQRKPVCSAPKARSQPCQPTVKGDWLYGVHAVRSAWLNPLRKIRRLLLTQNTREEFAPLLAEAKALKLVRPTPEVIDRELFERMLPGAVHQGVALDAAPLDELDLEDVLREAEPLSSAVLLVLDQVTDPHNLGAMLRSAAAFGALAVITPERNSPPLNALVAKTACGAVDVVPLVRIGNLARALEDLQKAGFWTLGLAESGEKILADCDLSGKIALVLGAEGEGLRRLTMEKCDIIARLPTVPPIGSLNVSNAAAVTLYEVARSRKV